MEKIILGIDPGTNVMGFGLIRAENKVLSVLEIGVIELQKIKDPYLKLRKIYTSLTEIVEKYAPDEMALEAPFYGKNVQSMLKLGRAQGVAMSVGLSRDIVIHEYAPRKIKMAITGTGAAAKEQVAAVLSKMLRYENNQKYLDATDALAVAVCHYYNTLKPEIPQSTNKAKTVVKTKSTTSSWAQFIAQNADRVVNVNKKK